jgi:8-oxo-dGTP pyrophosphatase MutT (NUDIX family)
MGNDSHVLTRLRSLRDRLVFLARAEWLYVAAFVGLVLALLPLLPGWEDWVSATLAVLGAALTVWLFGRDTRAISKRFGAWILSPLDPIFEVDPTAPELRAIQSRRGTIYRSAEIDEHLRLHGEGIAVRLLVDEYRLPRRLRDLAPYILTRTTATRRPFNGRALRLMTDPASLDPISDCSFQPVSYFDHLCSNELMKWRLVHHGIEYNLAREFMLDSRSHLLPLADSLLANVVGVSTLGASEDGFALLVQQTQANSASGGLLAPSGSGSLEMRDGVDGGSLRALIEAGATREMREETGIPSARIGQTHLTGYGRWLERGAKPEFFAFTALKGRRQDLESELQRVRRDERRYTGGVEWCPVPVLLEAVSTSGAVSAEAKRVRSLLSLPLRNCISGLSVLSAWPTTSVSRLEDCEP